MKKHIISLVLSACATLFAASPAATQEWVRNYVASNVTSGATAAKYTKTLDEHGNATIVGTQADGGEIRITGQVNDKLAIVVSNVTATAEGMGVTNGMLFAWNGSGVFMNGPAGLSISAVDHRIVFAGIPSVVSGGIDLIPGMFFVYGTKITLAESIRLLSQRTSLSLIDAFRGLFVGTARADTWEPMGDLWWRPARYSMRSSFSWTVQDNAGNVRDIKFWEDSNGNLQSNASEVIADLTVNVRTLFNNCSTLAGELAEQCLRLDRVDDQFKVLADRLDGAMIEVFSRLDKLKVNDDEYHRKPSGEDEISYIGPVAMKADEVSLHSDSETGVSEIKGFSNAVACNEDLTRVLTDDSQSMRDSHLFLTRFTDGSLHYLKAKTKLSASGMLADEQSITTNASAGASVSGFASLYGFKFAQEGADGDGNAPWIPFVKGSGFSLGWKGLDFFADGETVVADSDGLLSLKGWGSGVGNMHYFGTGNLGAVGFHELPNVTTNAISGDEASITSDQVGGDKILSLKGFNEAISEDALFAAKIEGELSWVPIPDAQNFQADSISIERFVDTTTPASNATFRILGFDTGHGGGDCGTPISQLLTATDSYERDRHKFLSWYNGTAGPVLHYTTVGELDMADEKSIVKGTDGKLSISGISDSANLGKLMSPDGSGGITYIDNKIADLKDAVRYTGREDAKFYDSGMGLRSAANFNAPDNWVGAGLGYDDAIGGFCLNGVSDAQDGAVPHAKNGAIEWKIPAADNLTVTGTDGVTAKGTSIVFASADDSNVQVKATSANGVITVTIGVYYK